MNRNCSLALVLCLVAFVSILISYQEARAAEVLDAGKLRIFWVDVEGGAATLIITPAGESILIDTGNPGERDPKRIYHVATKHAGIKQIDHLVTTHYHRDHYGGAAELSRLMPIINLYDNAHYDERAREAGANFAEYRKMKVAKRVHLKPGATIPVKQKGDTKLSITCLCARQQMIKAGPSHKKSPHQGELVKRRVDNSDNANSIVLLLKFGEFEFFDGGDLTWNVEAKLVHPFNLAGKVDVAQINHHGLDSSSNPLLFKSIEPRVVVINNGEKKGCQPLAFLAVKNTKSVQAIYQAHMNLRKDRQHNTKKEFIANLLAARECKGHHIKLAVAGDGKNYTFSVPSRDHKATYQTK
jgi:competence protein ComEC